jgi:hypothetical protein
MFNIHHNQSPFFFRKPAKTLIPFFAACTGHAANMFMSCMKNFFHAGNWTNQNQVFAEQASYAIKWAVLSVAPPFTPKMTLRE